MNQSIDWSTGWTCIGGSVPTIEEIELLGTFRKCSLTTKVLRIEVACNGIICEKSIPLKPGADLRHLFANLNHGYGDPFSIVHDMIDDAWQK